MYLLKDALKIGYQNRKPNITDLLREYMHFGDFKYELCIRLGNLQFVRFHKSYANLKKICYSNVRLSTIDAIFSGFRPVWITR